MGKTEPKYVFSIYTFHLGKMNKNEDIFSINSTTNLPINSGTIIFEHVVPKEDWEKHMNSKYKDYISLEFTYHA